VRLLNSATSKSVSDSLKMLNECSIFARDTLFVKTSQMLPKKSLQLAIQFDAFNLTEQSRQPQSCLMRSAIDPS
jgi:hypothetical protein